MPRPIDVMALADGVRRGSPSAVPRAITLVESQHPAHRTAARRLLTEIAPLTGRSVRVGISGVPGAGKSTFIDAMGTRLIERGHRVAVLAVDPSSTRTGGSVLGDRTRMARLTASDRAYVRPSPSGGHLGGVARATREAMMVVEAAGYDIVIVETVGVGQSEVAVAGMVDTFLLIALTGAGDQLQGIKRGILELADLIAVNKADGDNVTEARVTARELSIAMKLISSDPDSRRSPVLTCSAYTGDGLDEVWQEVLAHRQWVEETVGLDAFRSAQQVDWMWAQVESALLGAVHADPTVREESTAVAAAVRAGELSALEASGRILAAYARAVPRLDWAADD
ncbi:methylmalonyl Co-A mutase-associated GTPase MeaB [Raineyella fluvialis]|uniref:Methylmalonyl Co-A mutase-associated GTPase MeaB n=1 Tax=Raineyella fluvialis TaxID=2662261 RepID=A0A5Q2FDN4_9ACTN|nr:methylmalonyl Co-A mutase-associated GTPase MeaB [Raineyella fluvialis]QGF23544.1 methylmalonyl Co-A mutase-associated GTPase MeaB [Raineyella fluvialis]